MLADASEELSKFIFTSKYARWLSEEKRRETWEEAVDRVLDMHLRKFKHLSVEDQHEIRWAFDLVRQKRVLPSMRSLQFGGAAIEANNCRLFNCCCRFVDSIRAFAELGFLMLCGNWHRYRSTETIHGPSTESSVSRRQDRHSYQLHN